MNTSTIIRTQARRDGKSAQPMAFFIKYENNSVEFIGAESRDVKCGEIWMANLPSQDGSIQGGHRPVFIISNDKNNQHSTVINAIPLTTKMNKRNLPCHVEIWDHKKYGLTAPSTLLVEQLTTVQKENLRYYMGEIKDVDMLMRICRAMQSQFPILDAY